MSYVEGFVVAVPAANKETFRKHAADAAPLFKEFGATRMVEAWGDGSGFGENLAPAPNGDFVAIDARGHNLALKAARALAARCAPRQGAIIRLDKRIPHGGGLGGGSSDAATTLLMVTNKFSSLSLLVSPLITTSNW